MTDTDKSRFVATALRLWKEGQRCDRFQAIIDYPLRRCTTCGAETRALGDLPQYSWHEMPPPQFLEPAGADLLLRTLLEKGHDVLFQPRPNAARVDCVIGHCRGGYGVNQRKALLDAAYRLLKTDPKENPSA